MHAPTPLHCAVMIVQWRPRQSDIRHFQINLVTRQTALMPVKTKQVDTIMYVVVLLLQVML